MFRQKRIVIAQHERGLYVRNKRIVRILEAGVYWVFDPRVCIEVLDCRQLEVVHSQIMALADSQEKKDIALFAQYFEMHTLGDYEVGFVFQHKALHSVLEPGKRYVFWREVADFSIEIIDTEHEHAVKPELAKRLFNHSEINRVADLVHRTQVQSKQVGLLWIDGQLVDTLSAGVHAFWRCKRSVSVELVDLRLQSLEVSGQEILTRDKVSLRVNLSASYQFVDAVRAKSQLEDCTDYLYRKLQFALRTAIATRTLDALLADKEALNKELFTALVKHMAEFGIKVESVGVKDIILPGEMREILNQVVATEKAAQANIIRRREETAATRSLLNTAKLMNDNPTLLRLKEIEALEKVVEKVDTLTVYDGLNGLLRDTVRIKT